MIGEQARRSRSWPGMAQRMRPRPLAQSCSALRRKAGA